MGAAGLFGAPHARAAGIDWASVPGKDVVLFVPGQSPWEWALTADSMSGATKFRQEGKTCVECHDGEEADMGNHLVVNQPRTFKVTGKPEVTKPSIEPAPIANKPGSVVATVKFAHDAENLYVHLDVKDGNQPDAGQDKANASKVTVMFSASKATDIAHAGCFAACHDDMAGMPSGAGANRTHYLAGTHAKLTRQGAGDALKPDADLVKLKSEGYYLEDWQAAINPGQPAKTSSFVVFSKRDPVQLPLTAEATVSGGVTSVTLSGKLAPGSDFLAFNPGTVYHVSFAVHDGHAAGRYHYISLEKSLVLDSGSADFVATKK